ncbi:MAG: GNAT family N-acetyltransferase [Candidatus Hodarchaeota archaeon]
MTPDEGNFLDEIAIKPLENTSTDYMDIFTCCNDLVKLIPDLEREIKDGKISGLLAFHDDMCIGAIVATLDVDAALANAHPMPLPCMKILFIEVNSRYRGRGLGEKLLESFIKKQQEGNIGTIIISLFKNYKQGVRFFKRFGFEKTTGHERNKILLKLNVWTDFGVVDVDDNDII